jgi:hypothetical protein
MHGAYRHNAKWCRVNKAPKHRLAELLLRNAQKRCPGTCSVAFPCPACFDRTITGHCRSNSTSPPMALVRVARRAETSAVKDQPMTDMTCKTRVDHRWYPAAFVAAVVCVVAFYGLSRVAARWQSSLTILQMPFDQAAPYSNSFEGNPESETSPMLESATSAVRHFSRVRMLSIILGFPAMQLSVLATSAVYPFVLSVIGLRRLSKRRAVLLVALASMLCWTSSFIFVFIAMGIRCGWTSVLP